MNRNKKNGSNTVKRSSTRREFLTQASALSAGLTLVSSVKTSILPVDKIKFARKGEMIVSILINGKRRTLAIDPRTTLLEALRENIQLPGIKKGCDRGQCGSCTVLLNGRRINSCLTLAVMCDGLQVTTVEGLGTTGTLHPIQAAFLKQENFLCGYCTPGQICSAVGLINEGHAKTEDDIRELMSGNTCRCGAYQNIVKAIKEVQCTR